MSSLQVAASSNFSAVAPASALSPAAPAASPAEAHAAGSSASASAEEPPAVPAGVSEIVRPADGPKATPRNILAMGGAAHARASAPPAEVPEAPSDGASGRHGSASTPAGGPTGADHGSLWGQLKEALHFAASTLGEHFSEENDTTNDILVGGDLSELYSEYVRAGFITMGVQDANGSVPTYALSAESTWHKSIAVLCAISVPVMLLVVTTGLYLHFKGDPLPTPSAL